MVSGGNHTEHLGSNMLDRREVKKIMARVCSYPKIVVSRLIHEHDRTAKTYKNCVDLKRSYLNYSYGVEGKASRKVMRKITARCKEIMQGREMQKSTNVISEWVVTYPADLCHEEKYTADSIDKNGKRIVRTYNKPNDIEHCKKFFDEVYKFTSERYGEANMMAGFVHMDETTPQIHIDVVPEATSRKTGKRTVSSASLMSRSELRNYHKDLAKHMVDVFGKDAKSWILNGRTKTGETTEQMKARQAADEALTIKKKSLDKKEQKLTDFEEELNNKDDELTGVFLQVISDVTGKDYSGEEDIDDVIDDVKNWQLDMQELKENIENNRMLLKEERDEQEDKLRDIKNRIEQQLEVLGTVQKGTEFSSHIDITKYSSISKFINQEDY